MVLLIHRVNEGAQRASDVSVTPLHDKKNQVKEKTEKPFPCAFLHSEKNLLDISVGFMDLIQNSNKYLSS